VLEAVQSRKRVASMQLTNATVASFEDGVLTLAFRQAGTAKGFLVAENDRILAGVLADMFGVRARIATSVGASDVLGAAGPPGGTQSPSAEEPPAAPPSGASGGRRTARQQGRQSASDSQSQRTGREAGPASSSEPGHGDNLDADGLTGTDLIARELGGRIIEERDER